LIVTFDPFGGYGHPITSSSITDARGVCGGGRPAQYPEAA